jgi:hypothetical protein
MTELIDIDTWEAWSVKLVTFLDKYSKKINVVDFLGQIKQKIDECSRAYTGMWTLDMLHKSERELGTALPKEFSVDLAELQGEWNVIMERVREPRKELLGRECIKYFYDNYKGAERVHKQSKIGELGSSDAERWMSLCKKAHDKGLNADKEYQDFVGKLMVEMVKY